MRIICPAEPGDTWLKKKGTYRGAVGANGRRTAVMSCPECGESVSLTDHDITKDGKVTPSVVCPHNGCAFHEWIQLAEWGGGPRSMNGDDDE